MSYEDPQRWGDVDAGGNAVDWSTRKGKLFYPGYEMLRLALVERCDVSSTTVPVILQTARAAGKIYTGDWFSNFHNTMTALIGPNTAILYDYQVFVNHTDEENWNGNADPKLPWQHPVVGTVCKQWTEAEILVAIGDPSRIPAPDIPKADWSLQQYKLLNQLRWTVQQSLVINGATRFGVGVNQAIAAAAFLAASWVATGPFGTGGVRGYGESVGANWSYNRRRHNHTPANASPATLSCGLDFYVYPTNVVTGGTQVYDDEGQGSPGDGQWWLFDTVASFGPGGNGVSILLGDLAGLPPTPVINPGSLGWIADRLLPYAGTGLLGLTVNKWDVFGGFKFLDR